MSTGLIRRDGKLTVVEARLAAAAAALSSSMRFWATSARGRQNGDEETYFSNSRVSSVKRGERAVGEGRDGVCSVCWRVAAAETVSRMPRATWKGGRTTSERGLIARIVGNVGRQQSHVSVGRADVGASDLRLFVAGSLPPLSLSSTPSTLPSSIPTSAGSHRLGYVLLHLPETSCTPLTRFAESFRVRRDARRAR